MSQPTNPEPVPVAVQAPTGRMPEFISEFRALMQKYRIDRVKHLTGTTVFLSAAGDCLGFFLVLSGDGRSDVDLEHID